jgi:hypothetical protein
MTAVNANNLAAPQADLIAIAPAVFGVVIVIGLILAVRYGRRWRSLEPPPNRTPPPRSGAWHTRSELGEVTPPERGPGHQGAEPIGYERATREPEELSEVPRARRRRPHQIRTYPGPRT